MALRLSDTKQSSSALKADLRGNILCDYNLKETILEDSCSGSDLILRSDSEGDSKLMKPVIFNDNTQ